MSIKRFVSALLTGALCLGVLTACGSAQKPASSGVSADAQRYSTIFYDAFDTVTQVIAYCDSEEEFSRQMDALHADLLEYHRLYDIYNDYDGVVNVKTINDNAGKAPVQVDDKILGMLELARKNHVNYLFEASVGGGIPVLHPLTQCMAANRVDEIYGILNGTTNFILTKMVKEGASFAEVLKLAQEKGYAEADPTADVEGIDAGRKICILADLAFGHQVDPAQVPMEGITGIDLKDVEIAGRHGYRIKLLGRCLRLEGGRRTAYVAPHLISEENPMSDVNDVFNAVVVRGNATGEVMFYGKGAGELPTASACVADVIECLQEERHRPEIGWSADTGGFASPLTLKNRWYFRVGTDTLPEALHSAKVLEQDTETAFITPPITGTDAERLAAYLPTLAKMRVLD